MTAFTLLRFTSCLKNAPNLLPRSLVVVVVIIIIFVVVVVVVVIV